MQVLKIDMLYIGLLTTDRRRPMRFPFLCVQMVAVKQLARDGVQGRNEFLVEVLMLTVLNHRNLVSLVGFCAQGDERLLVYEYMPFGSLESHLFGKLFVLQLSVVLGWG